MTAKLRRAVRRSVRRLVPCREVGVFVLSVSPPSLVAGGSSTESMRSGLEQSGHLAREVLIMSKSDQMVTHLRRGESLERGRYEILQPMRSPDLGSGAQSEAPRTSPDGISAFVARVLDQLALSAWLPAAFLTAGIAIMLQFRSAKSANLLKAVQALTAQPLQILVIMIPLLVIATVVTQAFSFECIRILEGYWGASWLADLARRPMIWRHVRKQRSIEARVPREYQKAIRSVMPQMLMSGIPFPVVKAIEARVTPGQTPPNLTDEQDEILKNTVWQGWCAAWRLARIANLARQRQQYPDSHHVMPTKLGNLLRTTEEGLRHAQDDVQGFVYRRRDMVSVRVRIQHDQFRTRLEMYCTLVLVNGFLLAIAPIILIGHVGNVAFAVTFAGFALMSIVSYLAAIASARGYSLILRQMDEAP